jgi:hypothetical protein
MKPSNPDFAEPTHFPLRQLILCYAGAVVVLGIVMLTVGFWWLEGVFEREAGRDLHHALSEHLWPVLGWYLCYLLFAAVVGALLGWLTWKCTPRIRRWTKAR